MKHSERQQVLASLLELARPIEAVRGDLAGMDWDCKEELVALRPTHVIAILRRFRSGELNAQDVESWANAIESRDDIAFCDDGHDGLKEAIFSLANPVLQGPLTGETAARWLKRLNAGQG